MVIPDIPLPEDPSEKQIWTQFLQEKAKELRPKCSYEQEEALNALLQDVDSNKHADQKEAG